MAIQPTDTIAGMTNAQCAQLRDEILALFTATGIADPTVRAVKKRIKAGMDHLEDLKDEKDQRALIDQENASRQQRDQALSVIVQRRIARKNADYGVD